MTDIRQVLADNMKKYRRKQSLTQANLAERINTAACYIARIEIGKNFPSPKMLERIAQALNVDTPDLIARSKDKFQYDISVESLFQSLLGDFQQFERTITGRLEKWQQN